MACPADPDAAARFERSRQAVLARCPGLAAALAGGPTPEPVPTDGEARSRALARAQAQVAAFLARPARLLQEPPRRNPDDSALKTGMFDFLVGTCETLGLAAGELPAAPVLADGLLVVLGVGLGPPLAPLVEAAGARVVVVVESAPERLAGALSALDWPALIAGLEGRGGSLHVILETDADAILKALGRLFLATGSLFLDGAQIFVQDPTPVLRAVQARLGEVAQLVFMSRGFYEDERVMLTHAVANLRRHHVRLIGPDPGPAQSATALVIAAGPSLDRDLAEIRRRRASAVVFSCGTALQACLQAGIVPDFQCETENTFSTYQALRHARERFGLGTVTLVAPVSIDPRAPELFPETFLFFRDLTVPARMLAPAWELAGTAPTGANTAVRVAAAFGFRRLVLFGVDCGVRCDGRKHASGTVYQSEDQAFAGFRDYERTMSFPVVVPGNFGGSVRTDNTYNWSRLMLGAVIAAQGLDVVNCSDGAAIAGAAALPAANLILPAGRIDRPAIKAAIRAACRSCPPGALLAGWQGEAAEAATRHYFDGLVAMLAQARDDGPDLAEFWRRLAPFIDEAGTGDAGSRSLILGTATTLLTLGGYFIRRVADPGRRTALTRAFLGEYHRRVRDIGTDAAALVAALAAGAEPAASPNYTGF